MARLQRVCVHVFSTQSLNEVFAENLQFPHGLNLAKIAFLTLLGFNSNKPPLYYGTRSHCLDTARKSFIGRENREGKKERKKGREEDERRHKQTGAVHFSWGTLGTSRSRRQPSRRAARSEVPSRSAAARPSSRNYFWCGFTSHAPSHPPLLKNAERSRRGSLTKL